MEMLRWALLVVFFACIGCVAYLNLTRVRRAVARELRRIISEATGIAPSAIHMHDDLAVLIKPADRQRVRDLICDRFGFCQVDHSMFEKGPLLMRTLVEDIKYAVVFIAKLRGPSQSIRFAVRIWLVGVLTMTLTSIIGFSIHPAVGVMLLGVTAAIAGAWHVAILKPCPLWVPRDNN